MAQGVDSCLLDNAAFGQSKFESALHTAVRTRLGHRKRRLSLVWSAGKEPNRMPMGPPVQKDLKAKLGTILRDKQRILDMEENQAKRILVTFVKDSI